MKALALSMLALGACAASAAAQIHKKALEFVRPQVANQPAEQQTARPHIPVPVSPFQPDLTPGYVLFEGDIQVRLEEYLALINGQDSTFGPANYWPNGIVPYDFVTSGGGAVSVANQNAAIAAMNQIGQRAGVTFRPATGSDVNRIRFQNSSFNNSAVGMVGGIQIINIFNWNVQIVICHELYHALGFWHEQSRADRNTYITVNTTNICGWTSVGFCAPNSCQMCSNGAGGFGSCEHNFNIHAAALFYGFYDFDSFMHYPADAFTCTGNDTITVNAPWNAQWQSVIGQIDHFSYYDRITCRGLYPFAGDRWLDRNYVGTVLGTFLQPNNDPNFHSRCQTMPTGGTLFVKFGNTYSGVGVYTNPITIDAPAGAATIGN
jgi:hypothetical protein